MKAALFLLMSIPFHAFAAQMPTALKATEVYKCQDGVQTLSVQVLTNANGSDVDAVGTFIDYRRGGAVVYSSSSYAAPYFVAAGAGAYAVEGVSVDRGAVLRFGQDYMAYVASLDLGGRNVFSFNNCRYTGEILKFRNIGNPAPYVEPAPAPKKKAYKPTPYKKI